MFQWQPSTAINEQLQNDLIRTQQELEALRALLEELPQIFERKYSERLRPLLAQQQQLIQDNNDLRQRIESLAPTPGEVRLTFNADAQPETSHGLLLPALPKPTPITAVKRRSRRRNLSLVDEQPRDAWANPTRR